MAQRVRVTPGRTVFAEVMTVFAELEEIERTLDEIAAKIGAGDASLVKKQHDLSEEFERRGGYTYKSRVKSALSGLGFTEGEAGQEISTLSGGQRTRATLCKILLSGANVLLLDEPTNHLDTAAVEWLEEFLRAYAGAVVIISHDRYFLDRVTRRTFALEHKTLTVYGGNYSYYVKKKEEDRCAQERRYENTRREIKRIEGIIEQQRRWNRERNIKTAESKQKMIDRLEKDLDAPQNAPDSLRFRFGTKQSGGNDVLDARGISAAFGDKKLFDNADMTVHRGERVFLLGPNGCGKTTLLKILTGRLRAAGGSVRLGAGILAGYYDQAQEELDAAKTVLDEVWDAYPKLTRTEVRNALAAFLFKGDDALKEISALSGGERARVSLVKLMLSECNFLLLDEPTNHLDVTSREALEDALLGYRGTLLAVSHDRYFINKLADRVTYLSASGVQSYDGNYDNFLEKRAARTVAEKTEPEKKNEYKEKKEREAAQRKTAAALLRTEGEIAAAEAEIAALEAALGNPETAADYQKVLEISGGIDQAKARLDALYEKWGALGG
jgi:ATP-binding cassette subfamily F protein 3